MALFIYDVRLGTLTPVNEYAEIEMADRRR